MLVRPQFRAALGDRGFLLLWVGQTVCAFGERFGQMAILGIIFRGQQHQVAEGVSVMTLVYLLPTFVLGPLTARWVDRLDRRKTMIRADIVRAILMACIPLMWWFFESFRSFYSLVFVLGLMAAFYLPARYALIPKLTTDDHLIAANSLIAMSGMLGSILGFPMGALVSKMLGVGWGFGVNVATYLFSAFMLWRVQVSGGQILQQQTAKRHLLAEFLEGTAFLQRNIEALGLVILSILFNLIAGFSYVAVVTFAKQGLGRQEDGVAFLLGGAAVGMALGAALAGKTHWAGRWRSLPVLSLVVVGGLALALPFAARLDEIQQSIVNLSACTALMFLVGIFVSLLVVPVDTRTQRAVPEDVRGRVFAVRSTVQTLAFLISLLGGAWVVSKLGAPTALRWLGIAVVVGAALSVIISLWAARMKGKKTEELSSAQ